MITNLYPYTDAHELNEDWLIKETKHNSALIKGLQNTIANMHFDFDSKADKATTLAGYGITDAYTKTETDNLLSDKANISSLAAVATSGNYNDLSNKPTIPAAQVNSDWDALSGVAQILNKPSTLSGYGITDAYTKTEIPGQIFFNYDTWDIGTDSILNTIVNRAPRGISVWYTQQASDSPRPGLVSFTVICKPTNDGRYTSAYFFVSNQLYEADTGTPVPASLTWRQMI